MDLTGPQLCYNYTSNVIGPGELKTFKCPASIEGRFVRITKHTVASTALRLCEVIVEVNADTCTILDLALNKSATQSTTYDDGKDHAGDAWRSVDGNLDPNMPVGQSCSHTDQVGHQWWQVDLVRYYHITQVSIQNRDVVPHRLGNVSVEVSETNNFDIHSEFYDAKLCHYYEASDVPASTLLILPCSDNIVGRYIRISKFVPILYDVLSFCEVIVEGGDPSCIQGTTGITATTTVTENTTDEQTDTTDSPEITSTTISLPSTCPCSCRGSIEKYYNRSIESLLDELREELMVSKKETASYTRTLVSVDDGRTSSRNIGYVGIVLLVAVGLSIVVPDVVSLAMYMKGK
ncbi:uncharacterized protein [Argopecten irradians]|uniref:uncharacterized protein n=1 Tax=Argopecten irradians TaxID=31199 RepID=UPI00372325BC